MKNTRKFKSSKIRPIKNSSQVDKIENSLQDYFREEKVQAGDPVPKEIELAEAMGVSRTAIREALARFKTLGIIESKKNKGMVITHPDILYNMERVVDLKLLDESTMKDIFELRLVLEVGIAELIFLRKTDAAIKKIEDIVGKDEKTKDKDLNKKYDVEFHSLLYEMSGNQTIQRFQKMLLSTFNYAAKLDPKYSIDITKTTGYVTHRGLLECIKKGTPEEFRKKMRGHLMQYFDKL